MWHECSTAIQNIKCAALWIFWSRQYMRLELLRESGRGGDLSERVFVALAGRSNHNLQGKQRVYVGSKPAWPPYIPFRKSGAALGSEIEGEKKWLWGQKLKERNGCKTQRDISRRDVVRLESLEAGKSLEDRCRANIAHIRQPRPILALAFRHKSLNP